MFGTDIYYTPANVRRVKHILISFYEEDAAALQTAYAQGSESEIQTAWEQALSNIQGEADEVYARVMLDPTAFDEVMYTLTADPEVYDHPNGYLISKNTTMYDTAFVDGVFALSAPGDISPLVASSSGYHIIRLEELVPEGAVPIDQVYSSVYQRLLQQKQQEAFDAYTREWEASFSVKRYPKRYQQLLEKNYADILQ